MFIHIVCINGQVVEELPCSLTRQLTEWHHSFFVDWDNNLTAIAVGSCNECSPKCHFEIRTWNIPVPDPTRVGHADASADAHRMRIDAHHPHIVQKMTSHFLPINCHFGSVFPNPWAQSPIS